MEKNQELEIVLHALRAMRPPFLPHEADIHQMIASQLSREAIPYQHEASIGKGCRIDFLAGSIGLEIKKGKPVAATLKRQLCRYAACEGVSALVVITQRFVKLPSLFSGKPVVLLTLSQLWGVALP